MTPASGHVCFNVAADRRWIIPVADIGGLPIAVIDRAKSAELMVELALSRRNAALPPIVVTSANGQVLSLRTRQADIPDLFHDVAAVAQQRGAWFFILGATQSVVTQAALRSRELYPDLQIVGYSGGYLRRDDDEDEIIDAINTAQPDILWLSLGVSREQIFAIRHRDRLRGVGLIKTSGGLFDYISGKNSRAPAWMQRTGLEWAYRTYLEPRRLAGRYFVTNPHALFLLLTRTRQAGQPAWDPTGE